MVTLWRFSNPHDFRFAQAGRVGGTWQPGEYKERREPLRIEWEDGSEVVGDFVWPGLTTDIMVTERVAAVLSDAQIRGFALKPVQMVEDPKIARRKRARKRVRLPYDGPALSDLWVTSWVSLDRDRSTLNWITRADGTRDFEIRGMQREDRKYDRASGRMISEFHPRVPGQGLFVKRAKGIFRIEECPAWVFCDDRVKRLIEEQEFTNVAFLEMGDILDG